METETGSEQGRNDVLARFYALTDARRQREQDATKASYRRRIIAAAGADLNKLSANVQRVLRWLSEWDEPTVAGLVELLGTARMSAMGAGHRAEPDQKAQAWHRSDDATEAAMPYADERRGVAL